MKIKETKERDCCQYLDLKPYSGKYKYGFKKLYFCQHCGQLHFWVRRAGEMDGGTEPVSDYDMGPKPVGPCPTNVFPMAKNLKKD